MNKILILGGTGAMGAHLVSILENTENQVYVSTRKQRTNRNNITYVQGNAHDDGFIRPYITYSEIRLQLGVNEKETWLYRALHGHTIVFSEDIAKNYTTLTYGYDVARGIASIIGKPEAYGEAFHITQSKPMKWSEILNLYTSVIEEKTGRRPKVLMRKESPNLAFSKWQVIYDRWYNRRFDSTTR